MITNFNLFLEDYKFNEKQELMVKKWLLKRNLIDNLESKSKDEIINRFFKSYPKLLKKDINQYKTFDELLSALEIAESFQTEHEKKLKTKKEVTKATFGDKILILTHSPETSQFYGAGTTWCTAAKSTVYHWLLHRIIGVEFFLISTTDENYKYSIHINWDKKYSTVYNEVNSCIFNNVNHEYNDIQELRKYIDNELMWKWMMEQFDIVKNQASILVPEYLKELCGNESLNEMFNKFHYFAASTEDIIQYFNDNLNSTEIEYFEDTLMTIWIKDFKLWLSRKSYDNILDL